jgi:putative ABC transport system ATP-binding protein
VSTGGQVEPLLVAEQVRKVYRTGGIEVEALAGLDLTVRRGELVAVMGPSGSGKTTLLNCLSGLDDIDGGRVLVEGQDLFALSDARRTSHRARTMGFIFQAFNLIPVFSAAENVELPLLLNGVPASSSGSPSPAPWPPGRRSSGPTSPPATSTPPWPTRWWPCCTS